MKAWRRCSSELEGEHEPLLIFPLIECIGSIEFPA